MTSWAGAVHIPLSSDAEPRMVLPHRLDTSIADPRPLEIDRRQIPQAVEMGQPFIADLGAFEAQRIEVDHSLQRRQSSVADPCSIQFQAAEGRESTQVLQPLVADVCIA